jgi:MFS family permease
VGYLQKHQYNHIYIIAFWSSTIFALTGVLYGISMGVLLSNYSIPDYTNLKEFLEQVDRNFINFYSFSQLFAFISSLIFIVLLCTIYETTNDRCKVYARLSISFGLLFTLLACINYFIQFSIVRLSVNSGKIANLDAFVQFNPLSFASAINMLGWSLFLGLSVFFLAILFQGNRLSLAIRMSFYLTSVCCLCGFVGFVFDFPVLLFIFQMGMTLGLTIGAILLAIFFRKIRRIEKWKNTDTLSL